VVRRLLLRALLVPTLVANADASNDTYYFNNADAVSDPGFRQLGSTIALYFADQTLPKVAQNLGTFVGNKIAKTRGETDEQWCKEAALGALSELRDEASKRGGGAVIDIRVYGKVIRLPTRPSMSVMPAALVATSRSREPSSSPQSSHRLSLGYGSIPYTAAHLRRPRPRDIRIGSCLEVRLYRSN
jgi:hypothetical protein